MIIVNRGYTLTEHEPTTYNYRFQSVPTAVARSNIFPLSQNDPPQQMPAAMTDTGVPVFLTSDNLPVGALGEHTEIEFYAAWNSSAGANKLLRVENFVDSDGKYYRRDIAHDGRATVDNDFSSDTPIIFALCTPNIAMPYVINSSHALEYNTDSGNNAIMVAYQYENNGVARTGRMYFYENYRRYNRIRLAAGTHIQQDYVYTVTGGIVSG